MKCNFFICIACSNVFEKVTKQEWSDHNNHIMHTKQILKNTDHSIKQLIGIIIMIGTKQ